MSRSRKDQVGIIQDIQYFIETGELFGIVFSIASLDYNICENCCYLLRAGFNSKTLLSR